MVLVLCCGLGLDIQTSMAAGIGGSLGAAMVKMVPFALAGALLLRYGPASDINWPFLAFIAIAGLSIAILPMGRIATNADMVRSFIGSTAPFALGFALAPRRVWTLLVRGAAVVPIISALASVLTTAAGVWPWFDIGGRFQGMHTPPFLGGFCVTAIFAATLEYLRGFKLQWLIIGGLDLAILLLTQARAPLIAVGLFLGIVFLFSSREVFPLQRKVDLAMGGMVPGLLALGPAIYFAFDRIAGMSDNMSGRDIIWPYFIEAIEARPLFGFGLGAGKLIVNPEDPTIRAARQQCRAQRISAAFGRCRHHRLRRDLPVDHPLGLEPARKRRRRRTGWCCGPGCWRRWCTAASTIRSIASTALMQFSFFYAAMARAKIDAREMAPRRSQHGRREGRPEEGVMSAALAARPEASAECRTRCRRRPRGRRGPLRERRLDLDRAKGYAILLVVAGHLVANTAPEGSDWYEPLRYALYRFHMPFFLYLSGTVAVLSGVLTAPPASWPRQVLRRAERLLLPFFGIGLLILGAKWVAMQALVVDNPPDGLWGGLVDLLLGHLAQPGDLGLVPAGALPLHPGGHGPASGRHRHHRAGAAGTGAAIRRRAAGRLS